MKIAAITPQIHIADCEYNADMIIEAAKKAYAADCDVAVFPGFAVSGCSCGSLLETGTMRSLVEEALLKIKDASVQFSEMVLAVGFPIAYESCVALIRNGDFLKLISKESVSAFSIGTLVFETEADDTGIYISGCKCVFIPASMPEKSPLLTGYFNATEPKITGDNDFVFLLCQHEMYAGSDIFALSKLEELSGKYGSNLIFISSGQGESVDECVYSGLKAVIVDGKLCEYTTKPGIWVFDAYGVLQSEGIPRCARNDLHKFFLPEDEDLRERYCLDIMKTQAIGLGERLKFLNIDKVVLGLSGGLDSTLALIACINAFDRYHIDRSGIICVTMPGFGTSERTKENAKRLAQILGVTFISIDIREQAALHLQSIGQPTEADGGFKTDVTFENAQARMRTMILMDLANKENAIVVGTGDMSELALGWCTYNGDHMSNYNVNSGIPKTVIAPVLRTFISRVADRGERMELEESLEDIIATPVSPELLPTDENGSLIQKTEDSLGPYELHDFFLYYILYERGIDIKKLYERALERYDGLYDTELIHNTLKTFIKRFISQQFKRSCMPVGAKVFKYSLSPRSGFLFPGDAYSREWLEACKS